MDSVEHAAQTPDHPQPFSELGLKPDEYQRIRDILGRRPTSSELAMYSVMWSEHCSYKSSKVHLRQFGDKTPPTDALLVGIGENAGVVDIGDGWAVTFKVESHNHPSYIEPYQGAATGVGGIVRDILSMGARPLAVMDQLRFGDVAEPDTARVVHGVVAGVGGYGNCLGLPNIGGETVFDPCYQTNPLVNALCVGAMRHEDIHVSSARGAGNLVVLYGALTGGDGIGGVSVLASESFEQSGPSKRPAVQVGDPFMEKLLIECTLELLHAGLIEGIQDLGGAGLSCATSEMASNGDGGMQVWLDRVPLRDSTLSPEEILMSESQERMCAVVTPENREAFMAICDKWAVTATVIGEVTSGDRLTIEWHGETVVDVPPRTVAHDGPVYHRPLTEPAALRKRQSIATEPEHTDPRETLLALLSAPNNASKAWVTDQYDRYVRGNTVLAMPENAGVLRIDEQSGRGVAIATDCNARFVELDPYSGTQLALAEAYRNVAATGAVPLAVTNCLNFGSPEDPEVMWQFSQAVTGLADGCLELGIPVTGGNVSFYNQTAQAAIHPTPVVGVLGVFDDVARRTPMQWGPDGELIYLLGATKAEFGGSAVATLQGLLTGMPPEVDLAAEKVLAEILVAGSRDGMLTAAHDVADGGVGLALAEMAMRAGTGARTWVPDGIDAFTFLFSESAARALVVVPRSEELRFTEMCGARRFPCERIGVVDSGLGPVLQVGDHFTVNIEEMAQRSAGVLPSHFA
ncbi:MAG: phosphoribosylformylglycinamidine synthase subunit PurL [Actinobacteria bacterium]|nr:phosphoribosylformylglycinamidine synthase subunit PurL [Actinomycetota bacterium]MCO5299359.1 phosphoribosylformylglycinamidine synthase subunit PurL [Candidatus Nanopelagicales bacterium]MCB9427965.1 phosphoribosylformylglycinamidine synthase subunit PurL [Actinomycetota bacterium]HPE13558.1 phosphoribosylformylglycinamidine synthase subunit PurL [Actinomycetota bacterium]HPQ83303.1 phosphoribosylformylglycinamidine synthase subunit PurL [Actinomycetota bacterium]